jgi:hypothetical protein
MGNITLKRIDNLATSISLLYFQNYTVFLFLFFSFVFVFCRKQKKRKAVQTFISRVFFSCILILSRVSFSCILSFGFVILHRLPHINSCHLNYLSCSPEICQVDV